MRSGPSRAVVLAGALLVAPAGVSADRLVLKNGSQIEGEILSSDQGRIRIRTGAGEMVLLEEQVASIDRLAPWQGRLAAAATQLRSGKVLEGLEGFRDALDMGAEPKAVEEALARGFPGVGRSSGGVPREETAAVNRLLGELAERDSHTSETMVSFARIAMQLDAPDVAGGLLNRLGVEALRTDERRREWARLFLRRETVRLSSVGRHGEALDRLELLARLDPVAAREQRTIVALMRASAAADAGNYKEAFRTLVEDLRPLAPEIARNRVAALLRQLPDTTKASGRWQASLNALDELATDYPAESMLSRRTLLELAGAEALRRGESETAIRYLSAIRPDERTPAQARLLAQARFNQRTRGLDPADPMATIELAKWAVEQNLVEDALALLRRTSDNPALVELSRGLRDSLLIRRDSELLDAAMTDFEAGDPIAAAEKASALIETPDASEESKEEARRLRDLARREVAREAERRPYQAEVFYQNAERAYLAGELDQALGMLQTVLRQYPGTPAERRARALLPDLVRSLNVAILEGRRKSLPPMDFAVPAEDVGRAEALDTEIERLLQAMDSPPGS